VVKYAHGDQEFVVERQSSASGRRSSTNRTPIHGICRSTSR
jgi:hypothetical protein